MKPREVNIEQIESYCLGTMEASERHEFENTLKEDLELAREVEAYKKIFSGFDGLSGLDFKDKLNSWSSEWESADKEETQLIEAFVKGELHPDLVDQIEQKIATDKSFAKKVEQYQKLLSGFDGIKGQEFKEKMQSWEKETTVKEKQPTTKIRTLYRRIAIAASFLLIVAVGGKWYTTTNYGPVALIEATYFKPETGGTLGNDSPDSQEIIETQFAEAHEAMENKNYETALDGFENVLLSLESTDLPEATKAFMKDNARLNKALALLGEGNNSEEVKQILQEVIDDSTDEYYSGKAQQLLDKLNSFWFKIK